MARQVKSCTCPLPDTTLVDHVYHVLKEIPVQLPLLLLCGHTVLHIWFLDRECEGEYNWAAFVWVLVDNHLRDVGGVDLVELRLLGGG